MIGFLPVSAYAAIGAHIVIDAETGRVLDQKDATRKWYPASLTKIMSAYVTYKAVREGRISLNSPVVQSANSLAEPPSKMGFKVGTTFTVEAALKIIMIKSANDISVALAEAVAGSEQAFIDMMNAEARRMGLSDTRFYNPHGLPDNRQVSTARDMAILAQAFWRDFPEARDLYQQPGLKFGNKTLRSANREYLLRVPGANGMKTGYICNSGFNVAATATRRGRTLIAVVLGAASGLERIAHTRELMDKGFRIRQGPLVTSLPSSGTPPPADGYCRRNAKPGAEGIMARYDMQKASPKRGLASALSFAAPTSAGDLVLPGAQPKAPQNETPDSWTLPNGKTDWGLILDRTIGPRRIAFNPIPLTLGTPSGVAAPRLELAVIPVPNAKPGFGRVVQNASETAAVSRPGAAVELPAAVITPSPGAIFRGSVGFAVPVPAPSPRKN
ncbi:hypothetical protein GCM10011316_09930 [Roseibium aquae]|uniref:Peptidase S11 D-alanyl-D-alanine carboxypeptidase A N-terminal domain-containing protein n=1 Tax=Roseibium aquae TaxID=1323746 RepID=A0A916TD43_9HYPH|nr:D-alanyl-D-alanine carboxypeptidase family protein [Roseibium aquae]GGB39905.1 hypothetical protein GCM10011316_09930 [Roseibium aquae]